MKFSIKAAFSFFIGVIIVGLIMELVGSSISGKSYNYNTNKIGIFAILAIIYGFWKGRKSQEEDKS